MKVLFKFIVTLILITLAILNIEFVNTKAYSSKNFIKSRDTKFFDSDVKEFHIKSIGLGNGVWSSKNAGWQSYDHDEVTYKELHDLGFNSVRFYFRYSWFEEKDKNGEPAIFERFDRDIAWAKKYGIKIYFNLHYAPTNDFGFHGYSMWKLNDNKNNMINREKVNKMWEALAKRYADEDTILGWGLMNEPILYYQDGKSLDENLQAWINTAKMFKDTIRKYDNNHILFVEPTSMLNKENKYISSVGNEQIIVRCIDLLWSKVFKNDSNYCFEYHCYNPWAFSSKGVDGTTYEPLTKSLLETRYKYMKYIAYRIRKTGATPFLGEFGVSVNTMPCMGYNDTLTGVDFVKTTLDFCTENNLSFNYHQYRDSIFGLHTRSYKEMDNKDLYNVFVNNLSSMYQISKDIEVPSETKTVNSESNTAESITKENVYEPDSKPSIVNKLNTGEYSNTLPKTSGFNKKILDEINVFIVVISISILLIMNIKKK